MWILIVYVLIVVVGEAVVVAIGLALDRILPLASLPVSLSLFFVVLALGWPLAVRWTEPKHAKKRKTRKLNLRAAERPLRSLRSALRTRLAISRSGGERGWDRTIDHLINVPLRLSPPLRRVCSLDFPFTMAVRFRWVPSSLYTFPSLGLARDCRCCNADEFPEFDTIPSVVSHPDGSVRSQVLYH